MPMSGVDRLEISKSPKSVFGVPGSRAVITPINSWALILSELMVIEMMLGSELVGPTWNELRMELTVLDGGIPGKVSLSVAMVLPLVLRLGSHVGMLVYIVLSSHSFLFRSFPGRQPYHLEVDGFIFEPSLEGHEHYVHVLSATILQLVSSFQYFSMVDRKVTIDIHCSYELYHAHAGDGYVLISFCLWNL